MTCRNFLEECAKLRNNGWKAFKAIGGEIRLENSRNYVCTPLSAVCKKVTEVSYGYTTQKGAASELRISPNVASSIITATERTMNQIREHHIRGIRSDLIKVFGLERE